MADSEWGKCKDCKWFQPEPDARASNHTMGLCIEEDLQLERSPQLRVVDDEDAATAKTRAGVEPVDLRHRVAMTTVDEHQIEQWSIQRGQRVLRSGGT